MTDGADGLPEPRALYLGTGSHAAFAVLHDPQPDRASGFGVVFCPPFGWDDVCSYRSRRSWAVQLAGAGHVAVRLQLPGTGDAGGEPGDPGLVRTWTQSIATAARVLRDERGCQRVTAIGIGLGGLLAVVATADGAAIDDLVLWGTPARGRSLLRELRAFARLESAAPPPPGTAAPPEGWMVSGGFALSAETVTDLTALDVTELSLPPAAGRRVLVLDRDGTAVDSDLVEGLRAGDATITVEHGTGYGAMMAVPDLAAPPHEVFATVERWLHAVPGIAQPSAPPPLDVADPELELVLDGVAIRESPILVPWAGGELTGVLSRPDGPSELGVILLNAGASRRIGPNRMWVEAGRRWAGRGVTSLRLDFAGIGDSDGADVFTDPTYLYEAQFGEQVRAAIALLGERLPGQPIALAGLCSGAYWAFAVAVTDPEVDAALVINPGALVWDRSLFTVRDSRRLRKLARPDIWAKIVQGRYGPRHVARVIRGLLARPFVAAARLRLGHRRDALDEALDGLRDSGTRVLLLYTPDEPVWDEMERAGQARRLDRWANLRVHRFPGTIAMHTLRPLYAQRAAHLVLDEEIAGLRRTGTGDQRA